VPKVAHDPAHAMLAQDVVKSLHRALALVALLGAGVVFLYAYLSK